MAVLDLLVPFKQRLEFLNHLADHVDPVLNCGLEFSDYLLQLCLKGLRLLLIRLRKHLGVNLQTPGVEPGQFLVFGLNLTQIVADQVFLHLVDRLLMLFLDVG